MRQPQLLPIDHIGILAPDIESLVGEFRALGFNVVGPVELTSIDDEGHRQGLGQFSAHVMLNDDYIELTAVERPTPDHHLFKYLNSPWGIRLLILTCDDINIAHEKCEEQSLHPATVQTASRTIEYQQDAEARFHWFGLPPNNWPDALVAFVQHLTRDLVFDSKAGQHANGARGLCRLFYCADSLPEQYELLADNKGQSLELISPDQCTAVLGFDKLSAAPFVAAGIAVADIEATAKYLANAGIDSRTVASGISVQLQSGTCLIFEQQPSN